MTRALFITLIVLQYAFSSALLNLNVYERENRVDLMLSFDTPFEGKIKKTIERDGTIHILLSGVEVQKPFYRSMQKSFIKTIVVTKADAHNALVKILPQQGVLDVKASKTIDGFGLRLRVFPQFIPSTLHTDAPKKRPISLQQSTKEQPLNMLKDQESVPGWRYWVVLGILLSLLLLLWFVKRKGAQHLSQAGNWLMPHKNQPGKLSEKAIIRFQKNIDANNRVVLLEFSNRQYLMVVGNTNLLLDTFSDGHIQEEDDFAQMYEANKRQLDHFLQQNHPDAYEAFKANASKEEHP